MRDYGSGALAQPLATAANAADRTYGELAGWRTASYAPRTSLQDGLGSERYAPYLDLWLDLKKLDFDEAYNWAVAEYLNLENEKAKACARIQPSASYNEIWLELDKDPAQTINDVDTFRASDTMNGGLPPSSIKVRFTVPALCDISILPISVEPVNVTLRIIGLEIISPPIAEADPVTTENTPFGTPARSASTTSANSRV